MEGTFVLPGGVGKGLIEDVPFERDLERRKEIAGLPRWMMSTEKGLSSCGGAKGLREFHSEMTHSLFNRTPVLQNASACARFWEGRRCGEGGRRGRGRWGGPRGLDLWTEMS